MALLDEPTTGLDQYNENVALGAIAQWARNKTLIVVTHRPQVLRIVDRVIVMENGQVTMDGPRDAVLQRLNEQNSKPTAKAVSEKVPTDVEDDSRAQ
ncbi:hypothetical protein [Spirabiliibacterium mucosae]|uniref:hypothetical protein n=1 Tax=Spirabiliibacterium mucosae TaxID=28156 RepID=UPI0031F38B0C